MIVIDVGCARYGGDFSIERLINEFHPDVLYGFDPNQGPDEYPWEGPPLESVIIEKKAAWTFDGEIGFRSDRLASEITDDPKAPSVPCFDLASFIESLPEDEIALKIDAEGVEYELLKHLMMRGIDHRLTLVWVEWHPWIENAGDRRRVLEKELACEVREWRW